MNPSQKPKRFLGTRSSGMLLICLTGFLLLVFGGIIPSSHRIQTIQKEISEQKAVLKKHEALAPVYAELLRARNRPSYDSLPVPERTPLLIEGLALLPELFEGVARDSGLQLVSATPQARSLRDGHEALRMDARVRGDYKNMQTLLMLLSKLPCLDRIEDMSIEVVESGKEMRLTLWLTIG